MNNAGIMVGFVDDFLGSSGFPKACVWLPSGACFVLDEIAVLPAETWFSDAFDISDDNIVVASLQSASGLQTVALRLPIVP